MRHIKGSARFYQHIPILWDSDDIFGKKKKMTRLQLCMHLSDPDIPSKGQAGVPSTLYYFDWASLWTWLAETKPKQEQLNGIYLPSTGTSPYGKLFCFH